MSALCLNTTCAARRALFGGRAPAVGEADSLHGATRPIILPYCLENIDIAAENASFGSMEPTGENLSFVLPPALLAEVEAAADEEHRPVSEVLREVVEQGLSERRWKVT